MYAGIASAISTLRGAGVLGLAASISAVLVVAPAVAQNKRVATLTSPVAAAPVSQPAPSGSRRPLLAIVSIRGQTIDVYDEAGAVTRSSVSSGQPGYETPTGVFSIIQKNVEHYSNLYDDAPMPFMQRLTWSGIALHAGALPGYPASHGCIRLPYAFAERLFSMTQMGTRVIVMDGWTKPVPVAHASLVAPVSVDPALLARRPLSHQVANAADALSADQPETLRDTGDHGSLQTTVENDDVQPTGRFLDAARVKASAQLAEALRAAAVAKAAHRKVQTDTAADVRALRTAERALQDAERRFIAAGDARAVARTEREAIRAEEAEERAEADSAAARAKLVELRQLAAAVEARIAASERAVAETEQERSQIAERARQLERSARPISLFISRRDQRLYVRKGFEPVGSTQVEIRDAHRPIGTHVFTVMAARFEPAEATWHAVTVVDPAGESLPRTKGRSTASAVTEVRPSAALAALDRIVMSDDVRHEISEHVRAGSSLIISDESASSETGKGTDFVILTR